MHNILTVPGINNSGPDHWQSIWERTHEGVTRIVQREWDQPRREDWVSTIDAAVAGTRPRPAIVAHSLGCLAITHWAAESDRAVAGLVLVAIPDPNGPAFPATAFGFGNVPRSLRQRRTLIISSSDDAYGNLDWTRRLAQDYRAELVELSNAGHINAASGFGHWPEGWERVLAFVRAAEANPTAHSQN